MQAVKSFSSLGSLLCLTLKKLLLSGMSFREMNKFHVFDWTS